MRISWEAHEIPSLHLRPHNTTKKTIVTLENPKGVAAITSKQQQHARG